MNLNVLSGGAAQGLVRRLEPAFARATGLTIGGSFGAVGAMKDKFLAHEPCDLLILTEAMVGELAQARHLAPESWAPIGRVRTGAAVLDRAPTPALGDAAALRRAFAGCTGLYLPDPVKATAGIHVIKILRELGMEQEMAARLRPFPNGATAMKELAAARDFQAIGCTQVTEILMTPGVRLAGPLPKEFELVTVYAVGVPVRSSQPEAARQFAKLLAGSGSAATRAACGFE